MNKKISELLSATTLIATDMMVLVQNSQTKKVTIDKLFSSGIPVPVNVKNKLHFGSTPEIVISGAVSLEIPVTHLHIAGNSTITLADGLQQQVKILVATVKTVGAIVLSSNIAHTSITFDKVGSSATLMFTGGDWVFIGGTATVISL